MLLGWLKTVLRIKTPVPACCRLQCLRRSSRTRWGRRPLETGPCWTRSADRSSRRLRLPLWPAFSWSRPWLQTRSRFKPKGDWGLGAADILSMSKEQRCKAEHDPAPGAPQLCWQSARTQPARTNLQLFYFKSKSTGSVSISGRRAEHTRLKVSASDFSWGQTRNLFFPSPLHFRFGVCDPSRSCFSSPSLRMNFTVVAGLQSAKLTRKPTHYRTDASLLYLERDLFTKDSLLATAANPIALAGCELVRSIFTFMGLFHRGAV